MSASETTSVDTAIRYGFVVDLRRCTGCQACSVACKAEMDVPLGVFRTWVKQIEKGRYPYVSASFLPSMCNQCDQPICLRNCPTRATYQLDDGIVVVDPHRCIGCKYCIASCPYEVRYLNPLKKIVEKCEMCRHRLDRGLEPACVSTCPSGALVFGNMKDPSSRISQMIAKFPLQVLKPDRSTGPQVFYIGVDHDAAEARGGGEE